jgi:hypothetical protein
MAVEGPVSRISGRSWVPAPEPALTEITLTGTVSRMVVPPFASMMRAGWLGRRGRVVALTAVALSIVLVAAEFTVRILTAPH